ncbi:hypothetical protein BDU57DRAFT_440199 [Ampelomyces quisqualis]|uniref:Uncharacterized protein n=1 Tax=Ampelomyces quisqualis TaxID=50730 RepID=A0A6A5R0K6_AMPQU|nr:hypothetical protein BDU57DRAFT_440199 [Ampelomyces quisqualis]
MLPTLNALLSTPLHPQKRCTNALQNPSFESDLAPWLDIAFGSWLQRGIYTSAEGGHSGPHFYFAQSNATVSHTTLTLSQSDISIPAGSSVECAAWVASNRPGNVGSTRVEVFMDEVTCGQAVYLGTNGWAKVGGDVKVNGDKHSMSIVIVSDATGPEGSKVWVDEAMAGTGC